MMGEERVRDDHPAVVALEDGLVLEGRSVGARGTALGEMVFTTSMGGYQEAVTDPSYRGQILCFAAPMIGNYGTSEAHQESDRPWVEAVVMRNGGDRGGAAGPEGWVTWLGRRGVVAVDDIDTRRLVRHLREAGTLRGGVSSEHGAQDLVRLVLAHDALDGRDITTPALGAGTAFGARGPVVAAIDCGMKASIAHQLADAGAQVVLLPPTSGPEDVRATGAAALFLSNGPGDPGAVETVVATTRQILGEMPVFGICMGHQLLGRALGMRTERLRFGHRGANHPVRRIADGRVLVTVQNHGYAVRRSPGEHQGVVVTHESLFDGSIEGIAAPDLGAWSVQFHPEGRPGPHDARSMFAEFVGVVDAA